MYNLQISYAVIPISNKRTDKNILTFERQTDSSTEPCTSEVEVLPKRLRGGRLTFGYTLLF